MKQSNEANYVVVHEQLTGVSKGAFTSSVFPSKQESDDWIAKRSVDYRIEAEGVSSEEAERICHQKTPFSVHINEAVHKGKTILDNGGSIDTALQMADSRLRTAQLVKGVDNLVYGRAKLDLMNRLFDYQDSIR